MTFDEHLDSVSLEARWKLRGFTGIRKYVDVNKMHILFDPFHATRLFLYPLQTSEYL